MAYIVDFHITGLAGRDEPYSQKLDRKINVFYGPNGSGKTSLLRILNSAMSNDANLVKNVPFKKAEIKIYSFDYKRIFTYSLKKTIRKPGDEFPAESDTVQESYITFGSSESFTSRQDNIRWSSQINKDKWKIEPAIEGLEGYWGHSYLPTSRLYISRSYFLKNISRSDEGLSEE